MIFSKIGKSNLNGDLRKTHGRRFFRCIRFVGKITTSFTDNKIVFQNKNALGKGESHAQSIKVRKQKFFPNTARPPVFKQPVVFMNTFGSDKKASFSY